MWATEHDCQHFCSHFLRALFQFAVSLFAEFQKEHPTRITTPQEQPRIDGIPCGRNNVCVIARNEVCVGGVECSCRPGEARHSNSDKCQPVDKTPLVLRVITRDNEPLVYSSEYGNSDSVPYVEITDRFSKDLGRSIGGTEYAPRYVTTEVNYITHPKTINRLASTFTAVLMTVFTNVIR